MIYFNLKLLDKSGTEAGGQDSGVRNQNKETKYLTSLSPGHLNPVSNRNQY